MSKEMLEQNKIDDTKILEKLDIFIKENFSKNYSTSDFECHNNSYNKITNILLNIFVSLDNSWIDFYPVSDGETFYLIDLENILEGFNFNKKEINYIKENYLESFFIIKSHDTGFLSIYFEGMDYNELELFASNEYCDYNIDDYEN